MVKHDRILVTGGNGQLGRHVIEACAARATRAVGLGHKELDVSDEAETLRIVGEFSPRAIIHCAAYTNVDAAESDEVGAFRVNEQGSLNIARAAEATGAHLVAVSTDYVFPGTNKNGYSEYDATGPINVYGHSKLAGEQAIRAQLGDDGACIARTAWLFSRYEPNFVQTIARAARERETLDVVDDQHGNPTWCGHLASALVTCALERITGMRHLVDTPSATWRDLAQYVVETSKASCTVHPTTSDAFVRPAPRAAVSILNVSLSGTPSMGDWRDGVRASLLGQVF